MKINVKKLDSRAIVPSYAKAGDAGLDLTAITIKAGAQYVEYGTGLAVAIPEGHVGLLFPRSSVSDRDFAMANCVGVIDSGYRGEVKVRFKYAAREGGFPPRHAIAMYRTGERIAQLIIMPIPSVELVEVEDLDVTERGEGGFGSSDEKPIRKSKARKKVSKSDARE